MSSPARQVARQEPSDAARRLRDTREGRLTTGPETLQVNMGNRCNLNCVFCWNHSPLLPARPDGWRKRRLSDDHLDNIAKALPRLRPGHILVSGQGETMIHPELGRLLRAAQVERIPVSIQTNGVSGIGVEELCELGVTRLLVNLSAATPAAYERTHPDRGELLAQTVSRLEQLARLRKDRAAPEVSVVAVIQRSNHRELVPLVELAARTGATAVYLKGMELISGLESLALDEGQQAEAYQELQRARRLAKQHGVHLDATHLELMLSVRPKNSAFTGALADSPCYMGWYYLRVTCDGEIMFCCKDKPVGHLDEGSLYRIWRSPVYHLHRLAARDGDGATGILDDQCRACSNFARNLEVGRQMSVQSPGKSSDTQ